MQEIGREGELRLYILDTFVKFRILIGGMLVRRRVEYCSPKGKGGFHGWRFGIPHQEGAGSIFGGGELARQALRRGGERTQALVRVHPRGKRYSK